MMDQMHGQSHSKPNHRRDRDGTSKERNSRQNQPPSYSGNASSLAKQRPTDFPLRILVLSDMVGAIIGRSGGTIRQITQQSRARVDVHRKENAGALEKVITIYGNPENCSSACQKILEVMQTEANTTNRGDIPLKILAHNNLIGRIIGKSGATIKRVMEQTDTKITVSSSVHDVSSFNLERIITIKGTLENICKAESLISGKLRQSYESDLATIGQQAMMFPGLHPMALMSTLGGQGYASLPPQTHGQTHGRGGHGGPSGPQFNMYNTPPSPYHQHASVPSVMYGAGSAGMNAPSHHSALTAASLAASSGLSGGINDLTKEVVFLYIPNSSVGAIIGTGGTTIRDMISSSGSQIKVAQPGKDEPHSNERKVTIIGNADAQWKAQFMIFRKVGYESAPGPAGPQEATLKVEMMVPSNQVGRIIGKGGAVVRELQRLTRAIIKLPEQGENVREREGSSNPESDETPVHILGDFMASQAAQRQIRAMVVRSVPSGGHPSSLHQHQHHPEKRERGDSKRERPKSSSSCDRDKDKTDTKPTTTPTTNNTNHHSEDHQDSHDHDSSQHDSHSATQSELLTPSPDQPTSTSPSQSASQQEDETIKQEPHEQ